MPLYIWLYCLVWWVVQDATKVATYILLEKYNIFGINDTGLVESLVVARRMSITDDDLEKNEKSRLLG